jgi:hypothetical protein
MDLETPAQLRAYWREEWALIALLLAFFLGIVLLAVGIPFDARLFPLVIGGAGILLTLAIGATQWRAWRSGVIEVAGDELAQADRRRLATALFAAPVFGLLFWFAGFVVASLAAMLVLPPLMGYRDRSRLLLIAVTTVAVLALIGPYLLNVDLPHGLLGDWLIERFALRTS